ncbi:hypothetical protein FIV42_20140 [Persicimonas caeni]|jgi:hypothetical protein|uniref:Uncharacterized protein n=1 Tax=Persicimonas caeni TaxID=2292766 RepID=A0A4Y6PXL0_PERCE|nr:hypothetical protein [Persicimonas caeni]QDG52970.1 hypothetical protein FIV42_20140 [Persicimonas caeni]QED34192.1 hypothetical protein FRD00_20135 [Persicimonas caeni]
MASLKSTLITFGKLGLAGASICAIAGIMAVYQPDGTIQDSQADILDMSFIELSNSAKFASALDNLGHDEPQSFSINGNVVHFSVNYSRKHPRELMKDYQEEFVNQGLNKKAWTENNSFGTGDQMLLDGMTGGVVPTMKRGDEYYAMGGVVPANGADDEDGLLALGRSRDPDHRKVFKGHHFVEMFWDREKHRSTVTATWSDENFDYLKMVGAKGGDVDVDMEVPACPSCSRISRVRDLDPNRSYSSNVYSGTKNKRDLIGFYRKAMAKRGWVETESSSMFTKMRPFVEFQGDEASFMQFTKGGRFLTIVGYPDKTGNTVIHTVLGI